MVTLKKPDEIERMRRAGRVVADVHGAMREKIRPGVDTMTLSEEADRVMGMSSAIASFK